MTKGSINEIWDSVSIKQIFQYSVNEICHVAGAQMIATPLNFIAEYRRR